MRLGGVQNVEAVTEGWGIVKKLCALASSCEK